jgi:hypothetical protein
MEKYYHETLNALLNCFKKTILDVNRVQSYFNDEENIDGHGDLEFIFEDNSYLTLSGVGDAESIRATNDKAIVHEPLEVSDQDICSWQKHNMKIETLWNKLIGQKVQRIEIIWNNYGNNKCLKGCIIHLDIDIIQFYETESDTNHFYINESLEWINSNIQLERIEINEC